MTDRRPLVVGDEFITAPLGAEVSRAINDWICAHHAELDEVLKPHGVAAADILQPEYRRAVYRDEIRAALDR